MFVPLIQFTLSSSIPFLLYTDLSRVLKAQFRGLKKLIEGFPHMLKLGGDHSFNPHVYVVDPAESIPPPVSDPTGAGDKTSSAPNALALESSNDAQRRMTQNAPPGLAWHNNAPRASHVGVGGGGLAPNAYPNRGDVDPYGSNNSSNSNNAVRHGVNHLQQMHQKAPSGAFAGDYDAQQQQQQHLPPNSQSDSNYSHLGRASMNQLQQMDNINQAMYHPSGYSRGMVDNNSNNNNAARNVAPTSSNWHQSSAPYPYPHESANSPGKVSHGATAGRVGPSNPQLRQQPSHRNMNVPQTYVTDYDYEYDMSATNARYSGQNMRGSNMNSGSAGSSGLNVDMTRAKTQQGQNLSYSSQHISMQGGTERRHFSNAPPQQQAPLSSQVPSRNAYGSNSMYQSGQGLGQGQGQGPSSMAIGSNVALDPQGRRGGGGKGISANARSWDGPVGGASDYEYRRPSEYGGNEPPKHTGIPNYGYPDVLSLDGEEGWMDGLTGGKDHFSHHAYPPPGLRNANTSHLMDNALPLYGDRAGLKLESADIQGLNTPPGFGGGGFGGHDSSYPSGHYNRNIPSAHSSHALHASHAHHNRSNPSNSSLTSGEPLEGRMDDRLYDLGDGGGGGRYNRNAYRESIPPIHNHRRNSSNASQLSNEPLEGRVDDALYDVSENHYRFHTGTYGRGYANDSSLPPPGSHPHQGNSNSSQLSNEVFDSRLEDMLYDLNDVTMHNSNHNANTNSHRHLESPAHYTWQ